MGGGRVIFWEIEVQRYEKCDNFCHLSLECLWKEHTSVQFFFLVQFLALYFILVWEVDECRWLAGMYSPLAVRYCVGACEYLYHLPLSTDPVHSPLGSVRPLACLSCCFPSSLFCCFLVPYSGISFDAASQRVISCPSHIQCVLSRSFLGAVCLSLSGAYQDITLLFVLFALFPTSLELREAWCHLRFIQTLKMQGLHPCLECCMNLVSPMNEFLNE